MSRSRAVGVGGGVPGGVVLDIPVAIHTRDEGDGLPPGAECPLERQIHPLNTVLDLNAKAFACGQNAVAISAIARESACRKIGAICNPREGSGVPSLARWPISLQH